MKMSKMLQEIVIPEGTEVKLDNNLLTVKGSKGEIVKEFRSNKIEIKVTDKIQLVANNATKREKTIMGTFKAHILNMLKGSNEKHKYQLKICSGHFPMNVTLKGSEISVKNFLGEKVPRKLKIQDGVSVKLDAEIITVEGIDIEKCGQCAANIESLTRITNKDRRIFQDGIWITSKPGKVWK